MCSVFTIGVDPGVGEGRGDGGYIPPIFDKGGMAYVIITHNVGKS